MIILPCREADEDSERRKKVQERIEVHGVEMPSRVDTIAHVRDSVERRKNRQCLRSVLAFEC